MIKHDNTVLAIYITKTVIENLSEWTGFDTWKEHNPPERWGHVWDGLVDAVKAELDDKRNQTL